MGLGELLLAGLTGGIGAKAIELWFSSRKQERKKLNEQLQQAYGPLYFWTSQNKALFDLNTAIHGEYGKYFAEDWSKDEQTQDQLKIRANAMLDLANEYVYQIVENNKRVLQILERTWHNIDLDDEPMLTQFQVECVRYKTELDKGKGKGVPFEVYLNLGKISYMRPALMDRIKSKYESKRQRLDEMSKLNWRCIFNFDRIRLRKK
jgi:hypothetical protein